MYQLYISQTNGRVRISKVLRRVWGEKLQFNVLYYSQQLQYHNFHIIYSFTSNYPMHKITEERQSPNSISLSQGSIIQQYHQLEFSDQIQRQVEGSSQEYYGDLSPEKLKYLGVDKFPEYYRFDDKIKDISQTREDALRKEYSSNRRQSQDSRNLSKLDNDLYYRKKNRKSSPHEMKEHNSFNIDSFLNSQPISYKNYQSTQPERRKKEYKEVYQRNALEHVLQQRFEGQNREKFTKQRRQHKSAYMSQKPPQRIFEQKNNKIRDFIKKNQHKHINFKYQNPVKQQFLSESQQSITLITLPQPQQVVAPKKYYTQQPHKHKKLHHPMPYGSSSYALEEQKSQQIMQLRFEQVKINFLDNFLPESMKIGNNSYNFWKYANSKRETFFKRV